jgi:uroporphyrinogen decarboxylase
MKTPSDSLFIRSIQKKSIERTPVWVMRQAGRYLPEYRKLREKAGSFLSLCKTPEFATQATLQPLSRYPLDAAIVFSDILTVPDAMGLGLYFVEGEGPRFQHQLHSITSIERLRVPVIAEDLNYVLQTIRNIRSEIPADLPLIGFSGSPWTLACYMVEGGSSKDFKTTLRMMYESAETMHLLLTKLAKAVGDYLDEQVAAGVDALMVFDTWGGILTTRYFQEFSLHYMQRIVQRLKIKHPHIPIILFTKGGGQWIKQLANTGCDALSLDWTCSLSDARAAVGAAVALQGNLCPTILLTNPTCIRAHVKQVLDSYGEGTGHVFNLGHGITPDVPPDNLKVMIEAVHEFSPHYHEN